MKRFTFIICALILTLAGTVYGKGKPGGGGTCADVPISWEFLGDGSGPEAILSDGLGLYMDGTGVSNLRFTRQEPVQETSGIPKTPPWHFQARGRFGSKLMGKFRFSYQWSRWTGSVWAYTIPNKWTIEHSQYRGFWNNCNARSSLLYKGIRHFFRTGRQEISLAIDA